MVSFRRASAPNFLLSLPSTRSPFSVFSWIPGPTLSLPCPSLCANSLGPSQGCRQVVPCGWCLRSGGQVPGSLGWAPSPSLKGAVRPVKLITLVATCRSRAGSGYRDRVASLGFGYPLNPYLAHFHQRFWCRSQEGSGRSEEGGGEKGWGREGG